MKKQDITFVTDNNLCFSCGACGVSCHTTCIDFDITNAGRLHPRIDYDTCTNCGVCFDVCPGFDSKLNILDSIEKPSFYGNAIGSYMGRSTDEFIYKNSQSGGMVTATLDYLFEQKLIRYALVVKMDYSMEPMPKCFFATSKSELYSSQKSLYAPVDVLSALDKIKEFDGDIAVVGLPCHIEGIVSLIKHKPKKYSKIKYKFGLICDGILSFNAIEYFAQNVLDKHKVIYKNKMEPNYLFANVTLEGEDKKQLKVIPQQERFLLKDLTTPPRCHICFDKMNIHADIVFGDPWGLEGYDKEHGDSVVISRTTLGEEIIKKMIDTSKADLQNVNYQDILNGQKIEQRIAKSYQTANIYQKFCYRVPSYFKDLKSSKKNDNLEKQITDFLKMEENSIDENVIQIQKYIENKTKKSKIKQLIKKILFVEKWRK